MALSEESFAFLKLSSSAFTNSLATLFLFSPHQRWGVSGKPKKNQIREGLSKINWHFPRPLHVGKMKRGNYKNGCRFYEPLIKLYNGCVSLMAHSVAGKESLCPCAVSTPSTPKALTNWSKNKLSSHFPLLLNFGSRNGSPIWGGSRGWLVHAVQAQVPCVPERSGHFPLQSGGLLLELVSSQLASASQVDAPENSCKSFTSSSLALDFTLLGWSSYSTWPGVNWSAWPSSASLLDSAQLQGA